MRRGTAIAASSASASAASRRSSRPSRTSRCSRSPATRASPRCRTPGEVAGPASVRGALDALGADRIRHGIRAVEEPASCASSPDRQLVLDVCPISNLRTSAVASLDEHPLPHLVAAGVPCSISTDDPAMFGTDLTPGLRRGVLLRPRSARVLRGGPRRRAVRRGDENAPEGDRRDFDWPESSGARYSRPDEQRRTHMARADRRQAAREARRVERRPRAAGGGSRPCRRHDVLPEAARARALGLRPARDRLRRQLRLPRRRLGLVGARGPPQRQLRRPLRQQHRHLRAGEEGPEADREEPEGLRGVQGSRRAPSPPTARSTRRSPRSRSSRPSTRRTSTG